MQFFKSVSFRPVLYATVALCLLGNGTLLAAERTQATPALMKMLTIEEVNPSQVQDSLRLSDLS